MIYRDKFFDHYFHRILNSDTRILEGEERDHMLTIFQFIDPLEKNTRQKTIRSIYHHARKLYWVTYGDEPMVEELEGYYDFQ